MSAKPSTLYRLATIALALAAPACDQGGFAPTDQGVVQMALTAEGSDGAVYRLRNAVLHLEGPTTVAMDLDGAFGHAPVFEAEGPAGEYTVSLVEGWVMQRYDGESVEVIEARLVTANPTQLEVAGHATTHLTLLFETVDDEIEFATGDLEVWLAINHLDCEPGEMVKRSCGVNLIGQQTRLCDGGWWQGWSECEMPGHVDAGRTSDEPEPPACEPSCGDRECGDDGCGGSCGDCQQGQCQPNGICLSDCWSVMDFVPTGEACEAVCTNGDPMDDYLTEGICDDGECYAECFFWW
jgi:hypothetical protein